MPVSLSFSTGIKKNWTFNLGKLVQANRFPGKAICFPSLGEDTGEQ